MASIGYVELKIGYAARGLSATVFVYKKQNSVFAKQVMSYWTS